MFETPKPLGSAAPPPAFGYMFIALAVGSVLIQFRPGHTPERWDLIMAGLWIILGMMWIFGDRRTRKLEAIEAGGAWVAEAKGLAAAGDKIGAIKVVRNATHLGLAQAKHIVDSWDNS